MPMLKKKSQVKNLTLHFKSIKIRKKTKPNITKQEINTDQSKKKEIKTIKNNRNEEFFQKDKQNWEF